MIKMSPSLPNHQKNEEKEKVESATFGSIY